MLTVRDLASEDGPLLQEVFDSDPEFFEQTLGYPPGAEAVSTFVALPEGYDYESKWLCGALTSEGALCGVVDAIAGYPTASLVTVGLLFVATGQRRQGVGKALLDFVAERCRVNSYRSIRCHRPRASDVAKSFAESQGFLKEPTSELWLRQLSE